jgi:hypothetical protein
MGSEEKGTESVTGKIGQDINDKLNGWVCP